MGEGDSLGLAHPNPAKAMETGPLAMAEPAPNDARERRFDPLTTAAVVFFLLAVAFAAAPMAKAGPETLAGLLLLIGLAGVLCLGVFVLRAGAEPEAASEPAAEGLLAALVEPSAVASPDGRVRASNAAWREVMGAAPRLPKGGQSAASLFAALTAARRGEPGRAVVKAGGAEHEAIV